MPQKETARAGNAGGFGSRQLSGSNGFRNSLAYGFTQALAPETGEPPPSDLAGGAP